MRACRWIGAFLIVVGLTVLASPKLPVFAGGKDKDKTAQKKDDTSKTDKGGKSKEKEKAKESASDAKGGEWQWKAFDPDTNKEFYQKLDTDTTQTMKVMGMEVKQVQKQTFYIKWIPQKKEGNNWVVTQKIVGVKMNIDIGGNNISFDSTAPAQPNNPMTDFFRALLDLDLKYTIDSKDMKVVKIEGNDQLISKLSKTNPQMEPLLKSILTEDALKKMTEPTLFAFPTTSADTWKKESKLSLGPIGEYKTDFTFKKAGKEGGKEKIEVKETMTYTKPTEKGKLPFVIDEGELTGKDGTGYALFNPSKGRFDYYEMKMKLDGTLKIDIGGMKTTVELQQDQKSIVETTDTNPVEAASKKK